MPVLEGEHARTLPEQGTVGVHSVPVEELCGLFLLQIVLQSLKKELSLCVPDICVLQGVFLNCGEKIQLDGR